MVPPPLRSFADGLQPFIGFADSWCETALSISEVAKELQTRRKEVLTALHVHKTIESLKAD